MNQKFPESSAVVTKEWKYVKWPTKGYEQLFHLATDPHELNDLLNGGVSGAPNSTELSTQHKEIISQLQRKYDQLRDTAVSPNATDKPKCEKRP